MVKKAVRPIVLLVLFLASLFVFSMITNQENIDLTTTMDQAKLPVVHFVYNNTSINELHGYTQKMDLMTMRDSILPIGSDRMLRLEMMTYGENVTGLAYEIRSLDGNRLLLEDDSAEITILGDKLMCNIPLPSLFEEQDEYNLILTATVNGEEVYYYTRLMRAEKCYVDECLAFALQFHGYTFRDDAASFIPTYMDPATGDTTRLSYVDLSCTLRQITWAKFGGSKITEPVVSFKEINHSYNVLTLTYVMANVNENNEVEYYNVEEYYRLRKNTTRIYVLNFERRMNQIFRGENDIFNGASALLLGIRDMAVEYASNEAGDAIAFVQEGELWSYERTSNTLSKIFSFRGPEGIDTRENWNKHDIELISVDEAGSVEFIVYGYMNRGEHEGRVGIGVYHYDAIARTVEEEIFIESDKSYEVLKSQLGELMYVNEQRQLFLMLNGDVYCVNLDVRDVKKEIETLGGEGIVVSQSDRYVAWVPKEQLLSSTTIYLLDLKTGKRHEITSGTDTYLKPLAFVGEDFVYGVALQEEVREDSVGNTVFPLTAIEIISTAEEQLKVIKSYRQEENRIDHVRLEGKNIQVDLIREEDGRYVVCGSDTIMNRETAVKNQVDIKTIVTDIKQTQVIITMKKVSDTANVKFITPKQVLLDGSRDMGMNVTEPDKMYYVYQKGEVLLSTTDLSKAILSANRNHGVVVDEKMHYLFKRARSTTSTYLKNISPNVEDKNASGLAKCISAMLKWEESELSVNELLLAGQTPYYILNTTLRDAQVFELSGCAIDEMLYYIDLDNPVLAKVGKEDAILLIGYSSSRIYYYDPKTDKTRNVDYETMDEMLYQGGNNFIIYLK